MKNSIKLSLIFSIGALVGFGAAVQAQTTTVFLDNMESYSVGDSWASGYTGGVNNYSQTITAGVGVGNSQAVQILATYPNASGQVEIGTPWYTPGANPGLSGNTSANGGAYTLSFQMSIPTGGATLSMLYADISAYTAMWSGTTSTTSGFEIPTSSVIPGAGYQTVSINMAPGSLTYTTYWQGGALANNTMIWTSPQFAAEFVILSGFLSTTPVTEAIDIDNLKITMAVPEPSTLALAGLGAGLLVFLKRRNSVA